MRTLLSTLIALSLLVTLAPPSSALGPLDVAVRASSAGPAADTKVVAHRGGAAYGPENTMIAVANAHRLDVDSIEVDVMLSADDELVIVHDDTLERTTDCAGDVNDHTVAELRRCDAAYWWSPGQAPTAPDEELDHPLRGTGVTIPTLRELLEWASELRDVPELAIEVKSTPGESNFDPVSRAAALEVAALVAEYGLEDDVIVFSFWPLVLEHIRLHAPELRTLLLTTSEFAIPASGGLLYTTLLRHDAIGPNHDAFDFGAHVVGLAETLGREVYTYTVNTPDEQQRVVDMGVHGVISDWPACTLELLDRPVRGRVLPHEALANGARPMAACP